MASSIDWSEYEDKDNQESSIASTPFNQEDNEDWSQYEDKPEYNPMEPMELEVTKASKPKEILGFKGLAHDTINMLRNALHGGAGFIKRLPKNLEKSGKYIEENPGSSILHNVGQLAAGIAELGKGLFNLPHDVLGELGRKELIPEWIKEYNNLPFNHIPEGTEKLLGLEPDKEKGDELIRSIPAIATLGAGVTSLVKAGKRLVTAPSKETLFKRALEQRIDESLTKKGISEEQLKELKESLRRDYSKIHEEKLGEVTPIGQEEAINVKQGKIEKLKPSTEIPEQKIGEIPESPDTKAMIAEHQKVLDAANEAAETKLGIKENPHIPARGKIKKAIKDVKSSAEDLYKAGRDYYSEKKVQVDNSNEIKALGKEVEELSANEGVFEGAQSERDALNNQIKALEGETVNATDLFDIQRTLETLAENTRSKQYSGNVPELEFKRLGSIAQRLDARAAQLEKHLESVGGKDVQNIMIEANKGWRTYKQLTKENPVGRAAMKGNVPNDSLIKLADEYPANDFLKGLVNSDPGLRKNLLAIYAGENSVKSLIKPSTAIKKVLQSLPEVQEHVQALKTAIEDFKNGKTDASMIKAEHKELVDTMKKAAKEQKVRQDAIKESDKLKKQIKFHEDAIPKLEKKIKEIDKHSRDHDTLQKELKMHKQQLSDKNHLLRKYANSIVKITGLSTLGHKIGL